MRTTSKGQAPHYAWWIAGAGILVLFACLGLARFSFGALLPPTAAALKLSYSQQGWLGTVSFVGYLLMVAWAPMLYRRLGPRLGISLGLMLIAVSMVGVGLSGNYLAALGWYFLSGVGSGASNILIMGLLAAWFARSARGTAAGIVISGNSLGIIVSGVLVPVLAGFGPWGWRAAWAAMGISSAVVMVIAWLVLRNSPQEMGLTPLCFEKNAEQKPPPVNSGAACKMSKPERLFMIHLGVIYFVFGTTYMIYGSFLVTTLMESFGLGKDAAGSYWSWVGVFSLVSGPLFGRLSDRFGRKALLAVALVVQTAAYLLVASAADGAGAFWPVLVSLVLYGTAAFAIPTVVTAFCADQLGAARAASGLAFVTLFFGAGQVVGPAAAGRMADLTGDFAVAYLASGVLTAVGIALTLCIKLLKPR